MPEWATVVAEWAADKRTRGMLAGNGSCLSVDVGYLIIIIIIIINLTCYLVPLAGPG